MPQEPGKLGSLLLWTEPSGAETIKHMLRAYGSSITESRDDGMTTPLRLAIFDDKRFAQDGPTLIQHWTGSPNPPAILLISPKGTRSELCELLSYDLLTNLIARADRLNERELDVTLGKILKGDIFGIERYLASDVDVREVAIHGSNDKDQTLRELRVDLEQSQVPSRIIQRATTVADELLTNGVFNAAIDEEGNPKYARLPRREDVALATHELVMFRYASDGKKLALSVSDNFGRLDRSTLFASLIRCFRGGDDQVQEKEGGAGIGLYSAFENLHQLVLNSWPSERSEVLGVMDICSSQRVFLAKSKSLHVFVQRGKTP